MKIHYRRITLGLILLFLGIVELYLATAFLPVRWQVAAGHAISAVLPGNHDHFSITHPALAQEINQALRENIGLRSTFYAVLVLLLAGNAAFMIWVIRCLRNTPDHRSP